jgi:sec-independent protein translocase protein TatC
MNEFSQGDAGSATKDQGEMGLLDHLSELRVRIFKCIIAGFIGLLACFFASQQLFNWLMLPLYKAFPEEGSMIYTAPHEAFFTYIKVAAVAGIFVTSPFIFYQLWAFVKPGLYSNERKLLIPISFVSAVLFVGGAIFGYSIIFPYAYKFLMGFADIYITPRITMREGFSFAFRLLLAFGVVFELPVVIFFLARLGLVTAQLLRKIRKYAILCSFLLSAFLTPPDVVTQAFMAGPLIVLYEIGIWIAAIFGKKKEPTQEESPSHDPASQTELKE